MKIYNERAKRKNNPNHPLFAKKQQDYDNFSMPGNNQYQDITSIINDRYPMPKRTHQDPRVIEDMYNMSNFELDLLGYHTLEDTVPSNYRTFENRLMFAHRTSNDSESLALAVSDRIKQPAPINHLTGRQLTHLAKALDRKDLVKLPTHILANTIAPKLRMKDHMVSFKTIEPQEMIKSSWRARGSISKTKEKKQKAKANNSDQFEIGFFKDCIDKLDSKYFERGDGKGSEMKM